MSVTTLDTAPRANARGAAPNPEDIATQPVSPRPGSRADRMAQPLAADALRVVAEHYGVCIQPLAIRRIDKTTGETTILDVPCGARLASKCKPCAERNRRLRQQQIREGWHLTEEPTPAVEAPSGELKAAITLRCTFAFEREQALRESDWAQVAELDRAIDQLDDTLSTMRVRGTLAVPADASNTPRRARSTKRREDVEELPRRRVENRTLGQTYATKDGQTFQPSTFLTITLRGHGKVHTGTRTRRGRLVACECGTLHGQQDPFLGTPFDPDSYDYRSAALDAIFFAAGLDRFWQNLRRAAGWKTQYAGTVEMQKRLAPHAHYAMRGTLPRKLVAQVAGATYHQVWWPHFDTPVYEVDRPPVWDDETSSYVDPKTHLPLTPWAQAVDELDAPEAEPAYVLRLGSIHAKGITPGTKSADKAIKYATKYVTKDLTEQVAPRSDEQRAHLERLHAELSTLPCSPTCANWLLYGVQPDKAKKGLTPGACSGKVHQRSTLGFTGRRVLISRQWSGKTLADHRGDQRDWIRRVLAGDLADNDTQDDSGRYAYELARKDAADVPPLQVRIMQSIATRHRWKAALHNALAPPGAVPAKQDQVQLAA